MTTIYIIISFIIGTSLGSFFFLVGLGLPIGQKIVIKQSRCNQCTQQLSKKEMIPIVSYLIDGRKCQHCQRRISPVYVLVECVTGWLFAYSFWKIGFNYELIVIWLLISLLVIITVSDILYMVIPNKVLLFFLPLFIIGRIISPLSLWWDSILASILGFLILFFIALISKGGMGGGDIKLFFLLGIILGVEKTILSLVLAAIIGLIISMFVLFFLKKERKTPIPFGPSIALATLIAYFYGEQIIESYMKLF